MEVINQNNINDVINSIRENIETSEKLVIGVARAVNTVAKNAEVKALEKNSTNFKKIGVIVGSYTDIMGTVIDTFCKSMPEGKNLADMLGAVEEYKDTEKKIPKGTKYTVIDSIQQLSVIFDSMTETITKLSEFKSGFFAMRKMKNTLKLIKGLLYEISGEFISIFGKMAQDPAMNDILKKLVKQPDTTFNEIKNNIDKDGDVMIDLTENRTWTEQGQLGLLDVFSQTFALIGTLANLKTPNLLVLKFKLVKIKIALEDSLKTLMEFINANVTDETLKGIEKASILINGNDKNGKDRGNNAGLFTLAQKIQLLFGTLSKFKFNQRGYKNFEAAIENLQKAITLIVGLVNSDEMEILNEKDFGKRLVTIKNNITSVGEVFDIIGKMAVKALLIVALGWLIAPSIKIIGKIIDSLKVLKDKEIDKNVISTIEDLKTVIDCLYEMMKRAALLGPLAILGIPGLIVGALFVLILTGFVKVLKLLAKSLKGAEFNDDVINPLKNLKTVMSSLVEIMTKTIIMIPLVVLAVPGLMIASLFVLLLCGFVRIVGFLLRTIKRKIKKAKKSLNRIILLLGTLMMVGVAILLFAVVTPIIVKALTDYILPFILILGLSILIMWVLLKIINVLSKKARKQSMKILINMLIIIGIFVIIGAAVLWAAYVGFVLVKKNAFWYLLVGIIGIALVCGAMILLGMVIKVAQKFLNGIMKAMIPLIIVIGLLVVCTLMVFLLAKVGEYLRTGNAIVNILIGILAIIILAGLMILLGMVLMKASPFLSAAANAMTPLMVVIGLMVACGLMLLFLAWVGKQLREEDAIVNIIICLTAIIILGTILVGLGALLSMVAPALTLTIAAMTPLMIVIGLVVTCGLTLLFLAFVGQQITKEDAIANISVALGAIIVLSTILVGMGMALTLAVPLLGISMAGLGMLLGVVAIVAAVGGLLLLLGIIGKKIQEDDTITNVQVLLAGITTITWELISFSLSMLVAIVFIPIVGMGLTSMASAFVYATIVGGLLLALGAIGKKMQEENTIENVKILLKGFETIAWKFVNLGVAMLVALVFIAVTYYALTMLLPTALFIKFLGSLFIDIGAQGQQMKDEDSIKNIMHLLKGITDIAWHIAKSGPKMLLALVTLPITMLVILTLIPVFHMIQYSATLLINIGQLSDELDMDKVKQTVKYVFSFIGIFNKAAGKYNFWDMIKIISNLPILMVVTLIAGLISHVAERLNYIQEIELKADKITEHVNFIFSFIKKIQQQVSDILTDNEGGGNWFTRWKRRRAAARRHAELATKLNRVDRIVSQITAIAGSLQSIQDIHLDTKKIEDNVSFIFNFIGTLETFIQNHLANTTAFEDNVVWVWKSKWYGGYWEKEIRENVSVEKLNKVDKVVSGIKNIAETLKLLQQITINKSKIEENVNYIFDFIDELAKILETRLASVTAFDDDVKWVWVKGGWFKRGYWKEERTENQAAKKLNKVQEVMSSIGSIMDTLKGLGEFTIDDKFKATVKNNIDNLFSFIDELALKIDAVINPKTDLPWWDSWQDEEYMRRVQVNNVISGDSFAKLGENFGNVGKVVQTLADMSDSIKKLTKFKIKPKDKQRIEDAINTLFNASTFIIQRTQENLDKAGNASIYDSLNPFIDGLTKLNEGFDALSQVDAKTFKKNTQSFGDFITKVNSVNVEKVEKTANLFQKLTELTKEMKGDFGLLAEALTDKLLPVLEELKAVMSDVPEKMEKGFSNTSASIAAANAPYTANNVSAQVKRENPNMTKEEVEKVVETRMSEKARSDANGIVAKLDELISMFKGSGGKLATVKAI